VEGGKILRAGPVPVTAQEQTTGDALNGQLVKVDTITQHAAHVSSNVANLSTVVSAAAANPWTKVASFGYGVRKSVRIRRWVEEDREFRRALKRGR
jgi:hypothetical protein